MRDIDRAVEETISKREQYKEAKSGRSRRRAYEKSLEEVRDTADTAEANQLAEWIATRIREKKKLPSSKQVRKQGAKICRDSGYSVSTNDWLGS